MYRPDLIRSEMSRLSKIVMRRAIKKGYMNHGEKLYILVVLGGHEKIIVQKPEERSVLLDLSAISFFSRDRFREANIPVDPLYGRLKSLLNRLNVSDEVSTLRQFLVYESKHLLEKRAVGTKIIKAIEVMLSRAGFHLGTPE